MKKFKKVLLSILSLALVAILSIGGTLAYLKSEDSDVNVMTMGNVKIAQHEYERVQNADGSYEMVKSDKYGEGYKLQEFTQAKPLYPATGSVTGWGNAVYFDQLSDKASGGQKVLDGLENVQDKFVLVENTGKSDAYVRTIIAYEMGSLTEERFNEVIWTNIGDYWSWTEGCVIATIDGHNYCVVEATYTGSDTRHTNGVLPAGEYTYNSLAQVYMHGSATNEDVENIDGNGNGLYDILVLSQAVQTKGFANAKTALDTSFGETNATNAALWFAGMKLDVLTELPKEKDEQGEQVKIDKDTIINLTKDDEAPYVEITKGKTVINGNMNTAKVSTATDYAFIVHSELEINDLEVNAHNGGGIASVDGGKVTFNGTGLQLNATTTNPRYNFYAEGVGSEIIINDGEFDIAVKTLKRAYIYAGAGTTVYVNGGTFGKASTRSGYTAGILGSGKVIITGGTFGFNPSNWVATGYKAVQNGSTWTVVAE